MMNLILFFRLISMTIAQGSKNYSILHTTKKMNPEEFYNSTHFYCPKIICKDGFSISLQINNHNYCSSENGYRKLGHTWEEVEFGFPSEDDILLHQYSECYTSEDYNSEDNNFSSVGDVGRIPITVLEEIFKKHKGIDWEKTISVEAYNRLVKK